MINAHFKCRHISQFKGLIDVIKAPFVCWKVVSFWKVNSGKVNYFPMFGSVMENKLENTFQCLVMSWKMSWKITY
jgi:hypothetical protein